MAIYQDSSSGVQKTNVLNLPVNGNILTAATSVDTYTNITFLQTTPGITATLLNPTVTTVHKVIVLENLPSSTTAINIVSALSLPFSLGIGKSVQLVWNGTNWSKLIGDGKVTYGIGIPLTISSDNLNDTYILTDSGINTGIVQSVWVFDGLYWKKTVTIIEPVIEFSVNTNPNTALTTFLPNIVKRIDVLYRSTIDGSLWSSDGVNYISTVVTLNRTIQSISATGNIIAWNSVVQIGATPLTTNIILTLPSNIGSKNKDIVFKRLDSTLFTVTILPFGTESVQITTPESINSQYGALTIHSISNIKSQQTGNIGISGSTPTISYLHAKRINSNQTISSGSWSNRDIILNGYEGNIPYNTTTGVATLSAGTAYKITAGLGILAGGNYLIQYSLVDAVTNAVISPVIEMVQSSNNTFNVSAPTLNFIYKPSVTQSVKLRFGGGTNMQSGESIRFELLSNLTITQIGSTPTLVNQALTTGDFPVGGAIQATVIDPYVLGFNIPQTTPNQTLVIPAPASSTDSRIIYINNTGTADFKIGDITVGVNKTVAYIWNGVIWSNFSTEVVGAVLSEYGENLIITDAQPLGGSVSDVLGSSFTLPTAGIWEVEYSLTGRVDSTGSNWYSYITNTSNFVIPNSTIQSFTSGGNNATMTLNQKVLISVTGSTSYKLRAACHPISVGSIFNSVPLAGGNGGTSRITWKKVSGYLPVIGSTVDYVFLKPTSNGGSAVVNTDIGLGIALSGNLTVVNNTISLLAGKTYELEAFLDYTSSVAPTNSYLEYYWTDNAGIRLPNSSGGLAIQANSSDGSISVLAKGYITTTIATVVKLRTTLVSGAVTLVPSNSYVSAKQVGSTALITNTSIPISNLPTGGNIQTALIDPYILGFNINQTTANQLLNIPNPTTASVNRIIYINNVGTVSFITNGLAITAGQTGAFIWNGVAWSTFSAQTSGSVLSEYGENLGIVNNQGVTTSITDVTGSSFTIPSAGVWEIEYALSGHVTNSGQLFFAYLTDNANITIPNTSIHLHSGAANASLTLSQRAVITTIGAATYKLKAGVSSGGGTISNSLQTTTNPGGSSRINWKKISGFVPVIGQSVETTYAKQTTTQGTPSNGTALNFENIDGTTPFSGGTTFTLSANKTYYLQGAAGIMSGSNGGFSVQFYNVITGLYIGIASMTSSPANGQNHTPSGGGVATAKITPTINTQIQLRIINIQGTAGIIGGSGLINAGAGVGSGDSGNSASWLKITQEGSSAYSVLNTYVGATSTTAGITGGVPVSAIGDQGKVLLADGTWITPFTEINRIKPATATNTIDNTNFNQTWNWSTATTQNALNLVAPSLTTGALLSLISSATTTALTIPSGKVGIGTATPNSTAKLEVVGNILSTTFTKSGGLVSQNLLADGTVFDKYNSSISTGVYFQNSTLATTLIDGMTVTPPLAGTYKIDFNGQFNTQLANVTQQATVDLNALYLDLNSQPVTGIFPLFTSGTTITPGVYYVAGAVAISGTITLNGGGNANSIFIFRTDAALSTSASCVFNLVNGAAAKNIFFIAVGAITIGASSNISGTFISPSAPINIGSGAYINGRFYSIGSALTVNGSVILSAPSTTFAMGVLANFILFTTSGTVTNSGANTFVGDIGTNSGLVTGFEAATVSGSIYLPNQGASLVAVSIYIDNVIVSTSTRERVDTIDKVDVILTETVSLTAGQVISIKVLNSIGISRFYNRNLRVSKI